MQRVYIGLVCALLAAATSGLAADGDAAKGKTVFEQCGICHATDDSQKVGPGLKGLFKKEKLKNGDKATEANIRKKITEGGNGMPPYKLPAADMDNLIAYLKTL